MENSINYSKRLCFFHSDNDEERVMYAESDNVEIIMNIEADELSNNFLIQLKVDIKTI